VLGGCYFSRLPRHGVIQRYLNIRKHSLSIDQHLFISNTGSKLCYTTVNSIFLQLARSVGLRNGPTHPGVCIHDLRHRFAVKSLETFSGNRVAVSRHMVALSTYLGHSHISDTYWYLHATPILMTQIATTQEKFNRRKQQ
jgi:integrase